MEKNCIFNIGAISLKTWETKCKSAIINNLHLTLYCPPLCVRPVFVMFVVPPAPWILKKGGMETSGQIPYSLIVQQKG